MRFRPLPAEKVIKALIKIGFQVIRQKEGVTYFFDILMEGLRWFRFIRVK